MTDGVPSFDRAVWTAERIFGAELATHDASLSGREAGRLLLKLSIPGLVTGKPNVSFYLSWYSGKERRVEWEEEKIGVGEEGQPDGFV